MTPGGRSRGNPTWEMDGGRDKSSERADGRRSTSSWGSGRANLGCRELVWNAREAAEMSVDA